jgi:hypothetical protein
MGRLTRARKLRRLEGRAEAVTASVAELAEVRRERMLHAAFELLEDEDLRTLGEIVDAALEDTEGGGAQPSLPRVDLYEYIASERDVRALRALERALEDVRMEGAFHAR